MPASKAKRAAKVPSKKAPAARSKAVSKKAVAKKPVPAKKTPAPAAKKAPAKKAPAPAAKKPVPAKKAPAAKKPVPVKKAPAKKALAKSAPVAKAAVKPAAAKPTKPVAAKPTKPAAAKPAKPVAAKPAKPVANKPTQLELFSSSGKKATPARDAVQALTQKRAIAAALSPVADGKEVVDAYMRDVDHPFKAEMEAVRAIILGVSPKIAERIKWNAPSFYYKEDLGAFHPRATEYAHLILLFPGGQGMEDSTGLLEGNHKDRREAKFFSLDDVKKKQRTLEKIIKGWVALRD